MEERQIEDIKFRLYKEFKEQNEPLRRKSLLDYYVKQGEYVNRRLQEELNKLGDTDAQTRRD